MQQHAPNALERLAAFDQEKAEQIAEEAVAYFEAQHAELRLLDLEYRLGLTSEEALLRAYEDVAYLDASVLLGGPRDPPSHDAISECVDDKG